MICLLRFLTIIVTIALLCGTLHAQALPTKVISASTPNPVGSGARAVGMGGAFIAVADDATAASWNPAGLTQLKKPEFSFALSYFSRRDDFSSSKHPELGGVQKSLSKDLNYFSVAYPFKLLERNMIVSLNYQLLYEFDRDISTAINYSDVPTFSQTRRKVDFRQSGKLRTLSPAYAIEITPDFSLGATFNIWTDNLFWSNGWESDTTINDLNYRGGMLKGKGSLVRTEKVKDEDRYYGFSGFNMHLGFLWNATRYFTLGGVVKTPFTADIEHERVVTSRSKQPGSAAQNTRLRVDENIDLDMPLSYGLGAAFRLSDRLTLSLDVYRTEWDHFRLEDGQGRRLSPITLKPSYESPTEETTQVRMGAEYLFIFTKTVVPVRAGVFYDPEPSVKNPQDFWGVALGTGVSIGDLIFDCAYQFRYGKDASGDVFLNLPGTSADVEQHLFMVSMIYHF
jgi:long-subunit fatty acid transport protein